MIRIADGTIVKLGTGSRTDYIDIEVLLDKEPEVAQVKAYNFRESIDNSGVTNNLQVLNLQLFRHAQVPHIPCDDSVAAVYDSTKKVLFRQSACFWQPQTYTSNSLGDNITPGTPYTVPLMAHSMPQMLNQSAVFCSYIHLFTAIFNSSSYFETAGLASPNTAYFSAYQLSPFRDSLSLSSDTIAENGDLIHRYPCTPDAIFSESKQITPSADLALSNSGYFSRWAQDGSETTDPSPQSWNDTLADNTIAGSRALYGYGNTSNGGLSSYGFYSLATVEPRAREINLNLWSQVGNLPTFFNLPTASFPDMEGINEPSTNSSEAVDIDRCTNPSLNITKAQVRSDVEMFQDNTTLWDRVTSGGAFTNPNPVTIIHRIQDLRIGYQQLIDNQFADADSSPRI